MEPKIKVKFSGRATYRIKVQGKIDQSWSDTLGGMRITTEKQSENDFETTLEGAIKDQSELSGILNALYEMHLTVLSVRCLS
ncbi:hypothetical protein N9164_16300 [Draconibacterium sp.]|nr:hypothetical protein [Draconibacterium sp.]